MLSSTSDDPRKPDLCVPYQFQDGGEYRFRVRLYKDFGDRPVSVAIMLWGGPEEGAATEEELSRIVGSVRQPCRILKIVEVTATN
ncbi:MAG: hypothetical protein R3B96_06805 [Pirellulaceae bacterium]